MIVQAPCRLGERFRMDKLTKPKYHVTLTGIDLFSWSAGSIPCTTYCYKRDPLNEREYTGFAQPGDEANGMQVRVEIDTAAIEPGYPLRELGIETDAVGRLCGIKWVPDGWYYIISKGKTYGSPLEFVQSDYLDKLFADLLPLHAVRLNPMDYLARGNDDEREC